ncbi:hypothetical protein V5N11_035343 [Cardamine amara subsp. amara]|uniref:Uncharacterized protein n=1 Tax=Cardamine amara subsp. amara TaxID=228776 RepID=A0ABD1AR97_CARAN
MNNKHRVMETWSFNRLGLLMSQNARVIAMEIPTPPIMANNFEIKSSLINIVQNQRYNGLSLEDPLDHLDQFERLCQTVKMNGVAEESIKMILFRFSLRNKASQCEKNMALELVSTWDLYKKPFLTKFFPKQNHRIQHVRKKMIWQ